MNNVSYNAQIKELREKEADLLVGIEHGIEELMGIMADLQKDRIALASVQQLMAFLKLKAISERCEDHEAAITEVP